MSGCRLGPRDGSFDHAAKRSFPTPLGALAHFTGVGRRAAPGAAGPVPGARAGRVRDRRGGRGQRRVHARAAGGARGRRAARRGLLALHGGPRLVLPLPAKPAGGSVYDGRVTVMHVKGGTTRARHRGWRQNIAFHRGMGRFYRKFYAGRNPLVDARHLRRDLRQARDRNHPQHDRRAAASVSITGSSALRRASRRAVPSAL